MLVSWDSLSWLVKAYLVFFLVATLIINPSVAASNNGGHQPYPHPVHTYPPLSSDLIVSKRNSDKPIVYIHIGPHKTGSTHIQTLLMQNQRWLSNLGFCTASFNVTQRKNPKVMQLLVKELSLYGKSLITVDNVNAIKAINPKGETSVSGTSSTSSVTSTSGGSQAVHKVVEEDDELINNNDRSNPVKAIRSKKLHSKGQPHPRQDRRKLSENNENNSMERNLRSKKKSSSSSATAAVSDVSSVGKQESVISSPSVSSSSSVATTAQQQNLVVSSTSSTAAAGVGVISAQSSNKTSQQITASIPPPPPASTAASTALRPSTIKDQYRRLWPFTIHELDHCLEKSHQNMILSAENYMTMPLIQLVNLHYLLTEVYHAEVVYVAVYREYLNQVYSMYTQSTKLFHHSIRSFADYLFRSSDSMDNSVVLNINRIAGLLTVMPQMMSVLKPLEGSSSSNVTMKAEQVQTILQEVMSKSKLSVISAATASGLATQQTSSTGTGGSASPSNLKIIDYYGTMAANIDIGYVLFCEVIGIGCQDPHLLALNTQSSHENVAPTILYHQLYKVLRNYALARNYRLCWNRGQILFDNHNRQYLSPDRMNSKTVNQINIVIDKMIQSFQNPGTDVNNGSAAMMPNTKKKVFPNVTSNLEMFHPISIAIDRTLRSTFNTLLIHNNVSTHEEVLEHMEVISLDDIPFYHDSRWMTWLQEELDRQVKAGRMCSMHVTKDIKVVPTKSVK